MPKENASYIWNLKVDGRVFKTFTKKPPKHVREMATRLKGVELEQVEVQKS